MKNFLKELTQVIVSAIIVYTVLMVITFLVDKIANRQLSKKIEASDSELES